jgi:chaperonin GroES
LPLHDRVVIERNDAESKTFPTPPRRSSSMARSSSLDSAARDETGKLILIDVRVGDRIPVRQVVGHEVKIDGVEYFIMKESDIMRVLVEVEAKAKAKKKVASEAPHAKPDAGSSAISTPELIEEV